MGKDNKEIKVQTKKKKKPFLFFLFTFFLSTMATSFFFLLPPFFYAFVYSQMAHFNRNYQLQNPTPYFFQLVGFYSQLVEWSHGDVRHVR